MALQTNEVGGFTSLASFNSLVCKWGKIEILYDKLYREKDRGCYISNQVLAQSSMDRKAINLKIRAKTYSSRFCSCCNAFKWFLNTVSASGVSNTSNGIRVSSSQSLTSLRSVHGACSHSKKNCSYSI